MLSSIILSSPPPDSYIDILLACLSILGAILAVRFYFKLKVLNLLRRHLRESQERYIDRANELADLEIHYNQLKSDDPSRPDIEADFKDKKLEIEKTDSYISSITDVVKIISKHM